VVCVHTGLDGPYNELFCSALQPFPELCSNNTRFQCGVLLLPLPAVARPWVRRHAGTASAAGSGFVLPFYSCCCSAAKEQ
jgi:hypothetical protein